MDLVRWYGDYVNLRQDIAGVRTSLALLDKQLDRLRDELDAHIKRPVILPGTPNGTAQAERVESQR